MTCAGSLLVHRLLCVPGHQGNPGDSESGAGARWAHQNADAAARRARAAGRQSDFLQTAFAMALAVLQVQTRAHQSLSLAGHLPQVAWACHGQQPSESCA